MGNLVLEVDGVSAREWSKEDFYKAVDGREDTITLKIRGKNSGGICDYETKIRPLLEFPDNMRMYRNVFFNRITGKSTAQERNSLKATIEERKDNDFDFFYCQSFTYLITPFLIKKSSKVCPNG